MSESADRDRIEGVTAVLDEENALALARLALPQFGLPVSAPLAFVKLRENCVFRTEDNRGPIALRLHRPGYRTIDEIAAESEFIAELAAAGIPVAELLVSRNGTPIVTVAAEGLEVTVDAQRWVESSGQLGSSEEAWDGTARLTEGDFEELGALAARLHQVAEDLAGSRAFARTPWDAAGLVGEQPLWGDPRAIVGLGADQVDTISEAMSAIEEVLGEYGTHPSRYGVIHADFTPENVLVADRGLVVIDFDDFGEGWHMFDLATALFFYQRHPKYREYTAGLFRGYRTVRALTAADEAMLEVFLLARGLTYLGWAATRPETETAGFLVAEVAPLVVANAKVVLSALDVGRVTR